VPGITVTGVQGSRVLCQVTGPVRPLLAALAESDVRHLTVREPSLEELFLAHYGADGAAAAEAPDAA
jgi:ABC-2 type transport system ATP-binding protein